MSVSHPATSQQIKFEAPIPDDMKVCKEREEEEEEERRREKKREEEKRREKKRKEERREKVKTEN